MIAIPWLWQSEHEIAPSSPEPQIVQPIARTLILVASAALEAGTILSADKAEWIPLTSSQTANGSLTRLENADSMNPFLGRLIIHPVEKGAPLLAQFFASSENAGYIAQQITTGKRAYAITIDTKGTATAGNFILPNDRVDIIRSYNSNTGLQSETILSNIRILAIGQNVHGEGISSTGDTATVEVDIHDAEKLATAQRTGQISLALRNPQEQGDAMGISGLTIIRPTLAFEKLP